jgi:hypothetical protein
LHLGGKEVAEKQRCDEEKSFLGFHNVQR